MTRFDALGPLARAAIREAPVEVRLFETLATFHREWCDRVIRRGEFPGEIDWQHPDMDRMVASFIADQAGRESRVERRSDGFEDRDPRRGV